MVKTHNFISLAHIHYLDKDSAACQAYLLLAKALAKLKTGCVWSTKVEKFLNYIGKYRDEKKTSALNCKEKQKYLIRIYIEAPDLCERASSLGMVIKKTFFDDGIHTYYFKFLFLQNTPMLGEG